MKTKTIKLISNSGIQFENINIKISEDFNKRNKIFYLEEFHIEKEIFWFEQVLKNRKDDIWIRKSELQVKGLLDENEGFTGDYCIDEIEGVDEDYPSALIKYKKDEGTFNFDVNYAKNIKKEEKAARKKAKN